MTRAEKIARRVEKEAREWSEAHLAECNHTSTLTDFALAMMEKQREALKNALIDDMRSLKFIPDLQGLSLMKDAAEQSIKRVFTMEAENSIASLVGTPPIICEGCGGEVNPDYGRCIRCS